MVEDTSKTWPAKNWWKSYAIFLTAIIAANVGIQVLFMEPGRQRGIAAAERLLKLAGKRDFVGMRDVASPAVIEFMQERDAKFGKVLKIAYEDSLVQIFGTPAQIKVRVWREHRNTREVFTCNGNRVFWAFVDWPAAEEK